MRKSFSNERGATVVVVTISLLLLLGFAALAVDAGLGYNTRRGTTNAADNAALAAAWEECNPEGIGPEAAALTSAAENGYDDSDPKVEVTPTSIAEGGWQVTISESQDGIFGPATPYAADSLTVVSEAAAICDPTEFLDGMAIFAAAKGCMTEELALSGATVNVDGAIHSNGELQVPPSATLTGPVTYGEPSTPTPPGELDTTEKEYPLDVEISEYRPTGSRAGGPNYFHHSATIDNSWLVDKGFAEPDPDNPSGIRMIRSGIFYTSSTLSNAAIDLQSITGNGHEVTFVAEGAIKISGSNKELVGYDPIIDGGNVGMLFFSAYDGTPNCNPSLDGVKFNANASLDNSEGVIFAPNGHVQLSNASIDLNGSIIGFMVKSSGASLSVTYQTDPAFERKYRVELLR